jgi:drug/metabolite transporter (DMT)-like permease
MSAPYGRTVMTANAPAGASETGTAGRAAGRPMLTAMLGAACISSSAILVTLAHVGPVTTAFFRCALALPVLIPVAMLEQRRLGPRPLASRAYAVLAGLFLAVDLVLWNHAISDVGAGVATVLGNLQVLFVAAFAWVVLRERPDRRFLIMLPVVLAGIVLVSGMLGGHAAGVHPLAGIGFGVGTSAAYACFLLVLRSTSGQAPHVAGQLADATVGATVGAVILGLVLGGLQLHIPWPSFGWLLILALLSQTVGWLLITSALPRLPAAISSLVLLLQPAASMVLADLVLSERPTLIQVGGALLVCLGVLAVTRTSAQVGPARSSQLPANTVHASPVQASPVQASPMQARAAETSRELDLCGVSPARVQLRTENST